VVVSVHSSGRIAVSFEYTFERVALVKSLPGARYSPEGRCWFISSLDGTAAQSVERLREAGYTISQHVEDVLAQREKPHHGANFTSGLPLYDFQREIAGKMVAAGSCLNASFVGSGKTLTSLAVCVALQAKKVLIVVPKSVRGQWATIEIPKWLPSAGVIEVSGSKVQRGRAYESLTPRDEFYVVCGYDTVRTDAAEFAKVPWDVIICDEAHRLASTTTQTWKALKKVKSSHRFALTATPVLNSPMDLFGIVEWLRPGFLGSWYSFTNRYVVKDTWGSPKYFRHLDELAQRVAPIVIRKTLDEVGMELPDITESVIPVELSAHERKTYTQIRDSLLFDIEPHVISKVANPVAMQSAIVAMGKLFECCDSMELLGESEESSKLEVLIEHLESTLVNGQKAIVITRFSRMAEIIKSRCARFHPRIITGSTDDRGAVLEAFARETGEAVPQLLVGTEAIGQGLNLQMANVLYNYDCAWNPARMEQRRGRIHRNGQEKPCFVYHLVATKTVETWLQKKLVAKQEMSDRLLPKSFAEIKEMLT
jgi:SNF2 family DNA or RNA helicase